MIHGRSERKPHSPAVLVAGSSRVPARWRRVISRVLVPEGVIKKRINEIAREIERDSIAGELVVVALLNGTVFFLADLLRRLSIPLRLDTLGVSSYRDRTRSGQLVFTKPLQLDLRGQDVLVVDDILDTGKTLRRVLNQLRRLRPRRLRTCVLLEKAIDRRSTICADYVGFKVPDLFVVGYGLDYAERYRQLPFVGVLRDHEARPEA